MRFGRLACIQARSRRRERNSCRWSKGCRPRCVATGNSPGQPLRESVGSSVRLPKGSLGEDTARVLVSLVVTRVWQAATAVDGHGLGTA
jgi:hypothetical protein